MKQLLEAHAQIQRCDDKNSCKIKALNQAMSAWFIVTSGALAVFIKVLIKVNWNYLSSTRNRLMHKKI